MRSWEDNDYSPYFQAYNKSKRSVLLDLGRARDRQACTASSRARTCSCTISAPASPNAWVWARTPCAP